MHREEKIIKDILQIFHNSKGSISNNLARWQEKSEQGEVEWQPYPETPFSHAAGQYEQSQNDYT